jgi:hypothetical protein
MSHVRGLDYPRAFQLDRLCTKMVEQSNTVLQQDGRQVDVHFVKESRLDALLCDTGGAYTGFLRLFNRAFDSVRNERERRSFVDPFLWNRMGNDEDRYVRGMSATPRVGDIERPASRHQRAYLMHLLKDLCAGR